MIRKAIYEGRAVKFTAIDEAISAIARDIKVSLSDIDNGTVSVVNKRGEFDVKLMKTKALKWDLSSFTPEEQYEIYQEVHDVLMDLMTPLYRPEYNVNVNDSKIGDGPDESSNGIRSLLSRDGAIFTIKWFVEEGAWGAPSVQFATRFMINDKGIASLWNPKMGFNIQSAIGMTLPIETTTGDVMDAGLDYEKR